MALTDIKFANVRRKRRTSLGTIRGTSPQVERTNLSVTATGAAIAIRPARTAIRRMNNKGQGEVAYV